MFSAYRAVALILALALVHSIAVPAASAQDLNIETFADQIAPPPPIEVPKPTVKIIEVEKIKTVTVAKEKKEPQVDKEIDEFQKRNPELARKEIGKALSAFQAENKLSPLANKFLAAKNQRAAVQALSLENRRILLGGLSGQDRYEYVKHYKKYLAKRKTVEPATTKIAVNVSTSYSFDSNVFQKRAAAVADLYSSTDPGLTIGIPISAKSGFSFAIVTTFARFNEQTMRDKDFLVGSAGFATTLASATYDERSKTKQEEALKIGVGNQNVYDPGFSGPGTHIYTPAITWQLTGIPIGTELCGKKGNFVNCYVGGISVEASRKWIGNSGADKNTGLKLAGTFDWQIRGTELAWGASGSVTDRYYEDFPGDRNDVFFAIGTKVTWKPSAVVTVSAKAEYSKQFSTEVPLEYQKYVLIPVVGAAIQF